MPAATKNILRDIGTTKPWRVGLRHNGVALDLTGCSAELTLVARSGAQSAALSTDNSGIAALGVDGVIAVDLGHAQYVALPIGEYAMRLGIIWTNGEREYLWRGNWSIR